MIITKAAAKAALDALCEQCEKNIRDIPSNGDFPHRECPFRHISGDYCEEYAIIANFIYDVVD